MISSATTGSSYSISFSFRMVLHRVKELPRTFVWDQLQNNLLLHNVNMNPFDNSILSRNYSENKRTVVRELFDKGIS